MLAKIIFGVRFLARQGLALYGDGNDEDSNLVELLKMQVEDNPDILKWPTRHQDKHNLTTRTIPRHQCHNKAKQDIQGNPQGSHFV